MFEKTKEFYVEVKNYLLSAKSNAEMAANYEGISVIKAFVFIVYYELREKFCKHDWVDTSYGGPDYGYDSRYCTKCGKFFHFRMY